MVPNWNWSQLCPYLSEHVNKTIPYDDNCATVCTEFLRPNPRTRHSRMADSNMVRPVTHKLPVYAPFAASRTPELTIHCNTVQRRRCARGDPQPPLEEARRKSHHRTRPSLRRDPQDSGADLPAPDFQVTAATTRFAIVNSSSGRVILCIHRRCARIFRLCRRRRHGERDTRC